MKMKKGAMELSVGTIVIIVLAMSMLILGIILIRGIFTGSTNAIDEVNKNVINEINDAFGDPDKKIVVYPTARTVTIGQGDTGKGFAFSVKNKDIQQHDFTWKVAVDEEYKIEEKCKITSGEANFWIVQDTGSFTLGNSARLDLPILIKFNIPELAPNCQIPYKLDILTENENYYGGAQVYLDIV